MLLFAPNNHVPVRFVEHPIVVNCLEMLSMKEYERRRINLIDQKLRCIFTESTDDYLYSLLTIYLTNLQLNQLSEIVTLVTI